MIKINIIPRNKKFYLYIKNPNQFIQNKVKNLNKNLKNYKKQILYCTILLSGDKEIKRLNYRFRKKKGTTDVLSFPFYKKEDLKHKLKKENEIYLGDIIINFNKIKKKNKTIFKAELNKLWIHGLTHLFGHDHKKDKDFKKMSRVEKKFLSFI